MTTVQKAFNLHRGSVAFAFVCVVFVMLATSHLDAGSVFMKNGYIIQGPIVDYSDDSVVLGWSNGKAYIYSRFYETVVFDLGEEAEIERRRAEAENSTGRVIEDEVVIQGMVDEEGLPEDFHELVSSVVPGLMDGGDGILVDSHDLVEGLPGNRGTVDVRDVVVSGDSVGVTKFASRQYISDLGVSLSPPEGWVREDGAGNVRWTGPAQGDRFLPSMVIVSAPLTEEWSLEDALKALREDPVAVFDYFTVLQESDRDVGGRKAYEIVGEARARGDGVPAGSSLRVTQVLVSATQRYWLITSFTSEGTTESVQTALDQALASVEFLENE